MKKKHIRSTAQVNLHLLAELGLPEAINYQKVFPFGKSLIDFMPKKAVKSIAAVAEILYASTNARIEEIDHPVILDLACGYGPRAMKMVPKGYCYIGGDLASVVDDVHSQLLLQKEYATYADVFRMIDVTNREQMQEALANETRPVTVVTQGLLTYLNAERKEQLCANIHALLEKNGGCWLIPDVNPDRMLNDTFKAVMGDSLLVKTIYAVRDKMLDRNDKVINWNNCEEIVQGLDEAGFSVEVMSLWTEGLQMHVLEGLDEKHQEKLLDCWKNLNFICARVRK